MKIQGEKYSIMKDAVAKVVNFVGVEKVKHYLSTDQKKVFLWNVWAAANFDLRNDDNHPTYKNRARIVPYRPDFNVYSDGVNDSHIETAIRRIFKELGCNPKAD